MTRVASASPPEAALVTSLRHKADFDRVFRTGRRRRSGGIVVITAEGEPDRFRLGLVVGRRVGGAVDRNLVKRRLRHAVKAVSPPKGIDAVVIGSPEVARIPFHRLVQWLEAGLAGDGRNTGGTVT